MDIVLFVLYTIAIAIITLLLYSLFNKPEKQLTVHKLTPVLVPTHWWGYGWRPWWKRYNGLPGVAKPLPSPSIPNPPKPIIVQKP